MYRLPEDDRYTYMAQTQGVPRRLASTNELDGLSGFVMAPFDASEGCGIWLMTPDVVETHEVGPAETFVPNAGDEPDDEQAKADYARCFDLFHAAVAGGRFGKLVLSRAIPGHYPQGATPQSLFLKACRIYPHQMIALVSMPETGTWLMATPEVLLEGQGNAWQTMALAGTMPHAAEGQEVVWSEKNRAEQRYVTTYIHDLLRRHADHVELRGPYTTMAAHLLHLRTDFHFSLRQPNRLGSLLNDLYPTPAVCGLPKEEAREWIVSHEAGQRAYYSGFCGPIDPMGHTHLYVSLRCMELRPDRPMLYAGGGILPRSTMEQEWRETEAKLQTMRRLLK